MRGIDLRCRRCGAGEEGLQIAMHPFPQVGYVVQDISACSFGEKTVICGNNDSAIEDGEVEDPIREEQGEERSAGDLLIMNTLTE